MGAAYLGTAPIFILEGPYGSCELWSDELGYLLYFEPSDADEYKAHPPIQVGKYANRSNVIEDAFEDAKFIGTRDYDKCPELRVNNVSIKEYLKKSNGIFFPYIRFWEQTCMMI